MEPHNCLGPDLQASPLLVRNFQLFLAFSAVLRTNFSSYYYADFTELASC